MLEAGFRGVRAVGVFPDAANDMSAPRVVETDGPVLNSRLLPQRQLPRLRDTLVSQAVDRLPASATAVQPRRMKPTRLALFLRNFGGESASFKAISEDRAKIIFPLLRIVNIQLFIFFLVVPWKFFFGRHGLFCRIALNEFEALRPLFSPIRILRIEPLRIGQKPWRRFSAWPLNRGRFRRLVMLWRRDWRHKNKRHCGQRSEEHTSELK